ncbi:thiamine/thiamine pyrophosphate ABC transporter permease [Rhizobium sp. KVB221]|uniref:Thiamine transport system permease protein ThiP n=1 Tax=Rhizobium setariae TaxID=2801340 RepID=A0A936YSN4_9HYPH|nr:thiamine/thiamine pyrophosphate ABC transporter permease [Rhizobium setariae]MBL0374117.1 thiamine/thiamine pyrophosphate ABC transporter permease [Rhizobium setariae]
MNRTLEARIWILAGSVGLALIIGFCAVAIMMLVIAGGGGSSWPPLGYIFGVTLFTIGQALASTALSLIFALPVALAMARRHDFLGRSLLVALMILPLGLPVLPAIFGLVEIWGRQGVVNDLLKIAGIDTGFSIYGLGGILLGHVFFNLPLAARLMLRALSHVPRREWQLAAGLDFPRFSLFRFVEWPAIVRVLPGIAGLIFMLCITSFTIVLTLGGGPATSTLEVAIYQALKFEFDPSRALLLSLLQLALTGLVFILLSWFPDPEQDRTANAGEPFRPDGKSRPAVLRDVLTIALFALFVGTPLLAILISGAQSDLARLLTDSLFHQALRTSLIVAASAGCSAVLLTYLIARARLSLSVTRPIGGLFRLPEFTLLIPPLALGAGWFIFLLKAGVGGNPAVAMVIAINAVMALPFTSRILGPELKTHALRTARLADSLDIHGFARLRIVDWPALKSPLMTALSFALALSLGDMGAIALFGSDNFITLPSLLYAKLGSYRTTDAAGLSLILGTLCLVLMLPAIRTDRRKKEETA